MGYIKKKIGDISNVPYVTFECDTVADVAAIDVRNVVMGSRCYVVDTGTTYALNSDGEWKEVPIGGGASSWNDLEDKPFYEETTTQYAECFLTKGSYDENGTGKANSFEVTRPIFEDPTCATLWIYGENHFLSGNYYDENNTRYYEVIDKNGTKISGKICINFNENGPSDYIAFKGFYGVTQMRVEANLVKTNVVKLDSKFLPDNVGTVKTVNNIEPDEDGNVQFESGTSSWNDLADRPFYEETITNVVPGLNITWDGEMEGDTFKVGPMSLYRVYDIPPLEQLQNAVFEVGLVSTGKPNGDIFNFSQFTTYQDTEQVFIARLSNLLMFAVVYDESYGYPTGLYLSNNYSMFIHSVTAPAIENTVTELKTIDPKYLPEALRFGMEKSIGKRTITLFAGGPNSGSGEDLDFAKGIIANPDSVVVTLHNGMSTGVSGEYREEYGLLKYPLVRPDGELYDDYHSYLGVNVENGVPTGVIQFSGFPSDGLDISVTALATVEKIKTIDPKYLPDDIGGSTTNLLIDVENNTYLCDIPLVDFFAKVDNEGLETVNISVGKQNQHFCKLDTYRAGSYIRCHYLTPGYTGEAADIPMLMFNIVYLYSDGRVSVQSKGSFTGASK